MVDELTLHVDLTTPEPIPEEGIARAVELMRSGALFRYGETGGAYGEAALLEQEFASFLGRRYVVAVNSGGSAIFLALRSVGVVPGDRVLVNAFTLAPVPGAVEHAGATAVLVEVTDSCTISLADLEKKAEAGAKVLLLSHMRGHIGEMEEITSICARYGLILIEDCAHSIGATWNGQPSGTFGAVGCFSTQTFKHLNSGEGGLLATDDDEIAARAILQSGSYMLYEQHTSRPPSAAFEPWRDISPNFSIRMTDLSAAILRPQLARLPARIEAWNARYKAIEAGLRAIPEVRLIERPAAERFVGSSLQFFLPSFKAPEIDEVVRLCDDHNLHIKWFGRERARGFTSRPDHWAYLRGQPDLPQTEAVLSALCDMRISPMMTLDDCRTVVAILGSAVKQVRAG